MMNSSTARREEMMIIEITRGRIGALIEMSTWCEETLKKYNLDELETLQKEITHRLVKIMEKKK